MPTQKSPFQGDIKRFKNSYFPCLPRRQKTEIYCFSDLKIHKTGDKNVTCKSDIIAKQKFRVISVFESKIPY